MDIGKILDVTPEPILSTDAVINAASDNRSMDYCLPVQMAEFQRELTDQVVNLHYSDILRFYDTISPTQNQSCAPSDWADSLGAMYQDSLLVATHPYLLVDHYMPRSLLLKEIPDKLARTSAKFAVLGDIVSLLENKQYNVALIARSGKTLDLVEAFLHGKPVSFERHTGPYLREPSAKQRAHKTTIHVMSSSLLESSYNGDHRFDLVIAFDSTFNPAEVHVEALRMHKRNIPAPVLRLVSNLSAEHVAYSFGLTANPDRVFTEEVIAALVVLRDKSGTIPAEMKSLYLQQLQPLAYWFADLSLPWPLPDLAPISGYSKLDVETSMASSYHRRSAIPGTANDPTDNSSQPSKRYKLDPISADHFAPPHDYAHGRWTGLTQGLLEQYNSLVGRERQLVSEIESHRKLATTQQLKMESQQDEIARQVRQHASFEETIGKLERKIERGESDAVRKEEAVVRLQDEVASLKAILASGEDADIKTKQQEEIQALKTSLQKANATADARSNENDYMRSEYQKASESASEALAKVGLLTTELAEANQRADGEFSALRKLTFDEEREIRDSEIAELKVKVENLEEQLKRQSEAAPKTSRARYGVRSSSVPRRALSPADGPNTQSE
ncbi:class II histone deacetylase complex subunits 2 and 3-domain-containing protein [Yarrowia lipolytica]|jgi:hypothetical protein|uniref:YALI0E28204p n=2 Tax=Yarrowia lipolytica TaxID=4952 RepID=Q6C4B7_YARLI|nr:YALI0E28204p [Yarrowia lipolytica CLIB122]AOW06070.1 hypothetical protein YALI1_E33234g [Yarrowia lipolytica]KAB8285654.1 class II histone deacetylase complex subunits 2 and 3-domain-containing protein [Yarrowia lipolytica]KAE8175258.1 class II histone deacetylase complex subunits 2 and 3-domain-containing protein [Yarrowia lipolytica]KAJ8057469.1 class II histone deacetylase complex subunits 2 and 3-domain-containing protein [Yarrowia lipolytica]QNP99245.1 HDA1 complex subunit 3 [Yarrowia |eukprot:XP_504495.1 YALI0E28204p [Yarrowia lipolytica CLIB122]